MLFAISSIPLLAWMPPRARFSEVLTSQGMTLITNWCQPWCFCLGLPPPPFCVLQEWWTCTAQGLTGALCYQCPPKLIWKPELGIKKKTVIKNNNRKSAESSRQWGLGVKSDQCYLFCGFQSYFFSGLCWGFSACVMKPTVQSCGSRQAEHSSFLGFLDHSDISQTDTAVPEGLENWSSYITVLISMGYISLSSGWSEINWLFSFFFFNWVLKSVWVDQKSECF